MVETKRFRVTPRGEHTSQEIAKQIEILETALNTIFPVPCEYGVCKPGEYSGTTVVDRLVDTPRTRIGNPPEGSARDALVAEATKAIRTNTPVVLVGIYGTPRDLDRPELNDAQLADLGAIFMMQAALDRVHSAHEHGAHFRAVDESLTALWLDMAQHPNGKAGKDRFQSIYKRYFNDRVRLLKALEHAGLINTGNTRIELVREEDLYAQTSYGSSAESPVEDFLNRCEAVRPLFLDFLTKSGEIMCAHYGDDDTTWKSSTDDTMLWERCEREIKATPEYSALMASGWQGVIPPEMRKYYLSKFRTIMGDAHCGPQDRNLLYQVATYLSSTLVKHKAGTITAGLPVGTPILRVPLVRPVDGRSAAFQSLVPQRTMPEPKGKGERRLLSNSNRPAWLSVGVAESGKLRLIDTSQFKATAPEHIVPVDICLCGLNGEDTRLVESAIILSKTE